MVREQQVNFACELISKAIRQGYSSTVTFAYKELLTNEERDELARRIESLSIPQQQFPQAVPYVSPTQTTQYMI